MCRILIVLTSRSEMDDTGHDTGFHFEEFTTPYYTFKDEGMVVELASMMGGKPPHDPSSVAEEAEDQPASLRRFFNDKQAKDQLAHTMALHEVNSQRYDAIYMVGGHGAMWDLPHSQSLADILVEMYEDDKIISAICHGPAALLHARRPANDVPIVKGHELTCFSDEEEKALGLDNVVPFLLQDKLEELGAKTHVSHPPHGAVVVDGPFITGQNPQALPELCDKVIAALQPSSLEDLDSRIQMAQHRLKDKRHAFG